MTDNQKRWVGLSFALLFATTSAPTSTLEVVIDFGLAVGWLAFGFYHHWIKR